MLLTNNETVVTSHALDWHFIDGPYTMEIRYQRGGKPPFHVSLNGKHLAAFDTADGAKAVVSSAYEWPDNFTPPKPEHWIRGRPTEDRAKS